MSYWVYLEDDNGPVTVERFEEGGTYVLGGADQAELNVTYNYHKIYSYEAIHWSIRDLHEKRAYETIPELMRIAGLLPNQPNRDYWAPTIGNAGAVVHRLLAWAKQHPDATWRVSG